MGNTTAFDLSFDDLSTLEMALRVYQGCLQQDMDGRPAVLGEYYKAGQLLRRVLHTLGRDEIDA